jgi:hypothetical protein
MECLPGQAGFRCPRFRFASDGIVDRFQVSGKAEVSAWREVSSFRCQPSRWLLEAASLIR